MFENFKRTFITGEKPEESDEEKALETSKSNLEAYKEVYEDSDPILDIEKARVMAEAEKELTEKALVVLGYGEILIERDGSPEYPSHMYEVVTYRNSGEPIMTGDGYLVRVTGLGEYVQPGKPYADKPNAHDHAKALLNEAEFEGREAGRQYDKKMAFRGKTLNDIRKGEQGQPNEGKGES